MACIRAPYPDKQRWCKSSASNYHRLPACPHGRLAAFLFITELLTNLVRRIRAIFALKCLVFLAMVLILNALYFAPQLWPIYPAFEMPVFWVDRAVPFSGWWALPYWSFYPLMVMGGLFLTTRVELLRLAAGVMMQAVVASGVFFACPTSVSRPLVAEADWLYHAVIAWDHPLNACPSLHASYSVYSAIILNRVLRSAGAGPVLRAGLWVWVAMIFASTIGLRQHVVLDLVAGTVLALIAVKVLPIPARA